MVCIAWASVADAAKRVALVIGNDTYATLPNLNNGRTDAKGMAAKLRRLGFDVILRQDASSRDFGRALEEFEGRLKNAEVGLVFYAGHGIQADGNNYLVPSDAKIEVEADLRYGGIKAADFLEVMERAGTPLNIVILDACRDNPLPKRSRSGARGLSVPIIPKGIKGTAIVYSAAPGQTAQDGPRGGHGVFTGELLKVLDRPGLTLEKVFKETATRVGAATNGRQDPWFSSSVKGDFFFLEGKVTATTTSVQTPEMLFWQSILDSERAGDYEAYLAQYPAGIFTSLARNRLSALKEKRTPPQGDSAAPRTSLQTSQTAALITEIQARHILVKYQSEAYKIIERLESGENFGDLARRLSVGPSGSRGGMLGYFTREKMVPPFSQAAFALKVGEFTKHPVETQFGWHVILVEDRK